MEMVSSPPHPELTWRALNPALTKFSGNFLTLIDVSRARQCLCLSALSGVVSAACSCSLCPAVGPVLCTDSDCCRAHALSEQHPRCSAGWERCSMHISRCPSNVPAEPQERLVSCILGMFRAHLVSAFVSKKCEGLFAWKRFLGTASLKEGHVSPALFPSPVQQSASLCR